MIDIDGLTVVYPNGLMALKAFTLSVAAGEFVAVVGPSGCGKSTLLRAIAGLVAPTSGRVTVAGDPVRGPARSVGIMFQDPALLPWRTVADNVALPGELGTPHAPADPGGLLELVGLKGFAHAYPRELSGGMAQRTALARALATRPPALLLDEPFGALDALTREALTVSLEAIWQAAGTTCLLVTHSISEAVFLADRVVVCAARPGQVAGEVAVRLPRPRHWAMETDPNFIAARRATRALLAGSPT